MASDAAVIVRSAVAEDLRRLEDARAGLEVARADVSELLKKVEALRPAHHCHVCGTKTREKE